MFSQSPTVVAFPPRARPGLRRGGPVLLCEVLPSALEQLLPRRPARDQGPEEGPPPHPGAPPLPHAA